MIIYNCRTCKKENRCSSQNDYARLSLFAFGRDEKIPECNWYQPDYWHGLEGVIENSDTKQKVYN